MQNMLRQMKSPRKWRHWNKPGPFSVEFVSLAHMPSHEFIVKHATIRDLVPLSEQFDQYRIFYKRTSNVEGAQQFLAARISQKDAVIFIAVDLVGTLVGFTQLYPLFSSTQMKRLWLLNDLFVSPDFRGKKISILLLDRAKQLISETGAAGMFLETQTTNTIGNQLYPRAGFKLNASANYYEWVP